MAFCRVYKTVYRAKIKYIVCYLHEVCQSCTNLVHGIVLQEQWIWDIHDVLFHRLTCEGDWPGVWETVYHIVVSVQQCCIMKYDLLTTRVFVSAKTLYLPNTFPDVHTKPMARDTTFLHWTIHTRVMCKIELWRCCTDTATCTLIALSAFITTQNGSPVSSLRLRLVLGTSFARQPPNPMMPYSRPGRGANLVPMLIVHARIWSTMLWYGLQQAGTLHASNRSFGQYWSFLSDVWLLTPSLRRPCIHAIFFPTACRTACKHAFCFLRVRPEAVSTRHSWLWQTLDDVYTRRCFSES